MESERDRISARLLTDARLLASCSTHALSSNQCRSSTVDDRSCKAARDGSSPSSGSTPARP